MYVFVWLCLPHSLSLAFSVGWASLLSLYGCWWPSWPPCLLLVATWRRWCVNRWLTDSYSRYWTQTLLLPEPSYFHSPLCLSLCLSGREFYLSWIALHNRQHCCSVLMNMHACVCVCVDHRHTIPGPSRQEELPSWDAISESEHWLDFGKHVQVTSYLYIFCSKCAANYIFEIRFSPGSYADVHVVKYSNANKLSHLRIHFPMRILNFCLQNLRRFIVLPYCICLVGSAMRTTVCITLCSWKPCSTSTPSSTELW